MKAQIDRFAMRRQRERLRDALDAEAAAFMAYCDACDSVKMASTASSTPAELYQQRGEAEGRLIGTRLHVVNEARRFEAWLCAEERRAEERREEGRP